MYSHLTALTAKTSFESNECVLYYLQDSPLLGEKLVFGMLYMMTSTCSRSETCTIASSWCHLVAVQISASGSGAFSHSSLVKTWFLRDFRVWGGIISFAHHLIPRKTPGSQSLSFGVQMDAKIGVGHQCKFSHANPIGNSISMSHANFRVHLYSKAQALRSWCFFRD